MAAPSSTLAAKTADLLAQADAARAARPRKAEELYTEVLKAKSGENRFTMPPTRSPSELPFSNCLIILDLLGILTHDQLKAKMTKIY